MQGEAEGLAVQVALPALGQFVVRGAVEAGIPVLLVDPQVEGAGERLQAGGLSHGAGGHVAIWAGGGGRGVSLPRPTPPTTPPTTSWAPAPAHLSSSPWAPAEADHSGTT